MKLQLLCLAIYLYMTVSYVSCQIIMTFSIYTSLFSLRNLKCHKTQFISMELNQVMNIVLMHEKCHNLFFMKDSQAKTLIVKYYT